MSKKSLITYIKLQEIDDDCVMSIAEVGKQIPFDIKRIYYMTKSKPNEPRGFHTHKELTQVIFCIQGSVDIVLDNGKERQTAKLSNPSTGILLSPMIWHEMHNIKSNTIMLVLASDKYDEEDYVREYEKFKALV